MRDATCSVTHLVRTGMEYPVRCGNTSVYFVLTMADWPGRDNLASSHWNLYRQSYYDNVCCSGDQRQCSVVVPFLQPAPCATRRVSASVASVKVRITKGRSTDTFIVYAVNMLAPCTVNHRQIGKDTS